MHNINISLPEEDYKEFKAEADRKRKNVHSVIEEKLITKKRKYTKAEVEKMMKELDKVASENSKDLKGWDSLKALREIRDEN